MRLMIYCIYRAPAPPAAALPKGIGGRPVSEISAPSGLRAAVSQVLPSDLAPDAERILEFEKVVEALHERTTVIPMRYGGLFEEESQVVRFLEEHRERHEALLDDLEGCVEMGIRILLLKERTGKSGAEPPGPGVPSAVGSESMGPGRAYLQARKARYEADDQERMGAEAWQEKCRTAFSGLYVKFKVERQAAGSTLASLLVAASPLSGLISVYFLVPRGLVESFRERFRNLKAEGPAKFLLSGPWPPFNFVNADVPLPVGIEPRKSSS